MKRNTWVLVCALLLGSSAWGGCNDDDGVTPDASADQAVVEAGADQGVDQNGQDLLVDIGSPDQGPADAGSGCNASLDLAPLTLASSYCVGARLAAPTANAFAFDPTRLWTFEVGSATRSFVVRKRTLDLVSNTVGSPSDVFGFRVAGTQPVFAGGYLTIWPATGLAAAGYTLQDQSGGIAMGTSGSTPVEFASKGNYDAVYLDADTLLINGLGAGSAEDGQGVYVYKAGVGRRLIKAVGSFSGTLALGQSVLFVGGFNTANEVWAFSLAEVKAAINGSATLSGSSDGDMIYSGAILDAAALGDSLVYLDDDFTTFNGVRRIPVTVNGDSVTKGTPSDVITPGASVKINALAQSGDWIGVRLTGGSADEIALIREK